MKFENLSRILNAAGDAFWLCSVFWPWPARFDSGGDAPARTKLTSHHRPNRIAGLHDVLQHLIHNVFLEYAEIAVTEEELLQGFQFEADLTGHVADVKNAKVRKPCFRTDRGKLRIVNRDLIARELVLPRLNFRECKIEPCLGVIVSEARLQSHSVIVRAFATAQ